MQLSARAALEKMETMTQDLNTPDAHQKADALLCDIILTLAEGQSDAQTWAAVVERYKAIDKWYE